MIRTVVALAMCFAAGARRRRRRGGVGKETRTRGRWMEVVGTRRGDDRDDVRGEKGTCASEGGGSLRRGIRGFDRDGRGRARLG